MLVQFEINLLKKNSAQGRIRCQHLWVRVTWPNIYSTEVISTYASRTYTSINFQRIRKPNVKKVQQTKKSNALSLASGALS